MKGLYLYCVKPKTNSRFSTQGIDGGDAYVLPYSDLGAVVSKVDLEEFDSHEIQKKAQEDLNWIKEKAQIHEQIIEKAMKQGGRVVSVIPMKFGTIFETKDKLEQTLEKHYPQFKKSLNNLTGKQEWAVKVYLNKRAFKEEIKKVSSVVQEKEKEIAQLPEGMAYFMQKQIDETVERVADKALQDCSESFFETLREYAEAGTKGKILQKELTGKSLPMILNAIFLISEKKIKDFVKQTNKLGQEFKNKGFTFEYSGPWPPYNFV